MYSNDCILQTTSIQCVDLKSATGLYATCQNIALIGISLNMLKQFNKPFHLVWGHTGPGRLVEGYEKQMFKFAIQDRKQTEGYSGIAKPKLLSHVWKRRVKITADIYWPGERMKNIPRSFQECKLYREEWSLFGNWNENIAHRYV